MLFLNRNCSQVEGDAMTQFIKFFVSFDLASFLMWLPILPLLMLPFAPFLWLRMVALHVAPMSWGGLFSNWLILSAMFELWFIQRRLRGNWRLVQRLRSEGLL
jgi:hypothetical protein